MMHIPLPLPILVLCIISFCICLFKYQNNSHSYRRPKVPENDYSVVKKIRNEFNGYESESFEVSVLNSDVAKLTLRHQLGYPVSFTKKGYIHVVVDGISIGLTVPFGSTFRDKVFGKLSYRAFITDRDLSASGFYDFFTITVFYKLG